MIQADYIFTGKAIFTGLGEEVFEGGVAVRGNRILSVFCGEIPPGLAGEGTQLIDVGNRLIMPAFVDAHAHFSLAADASSPHVCMKIEESESPKQCVDMLKEFEREHPFEERILGIGWYPANWGDVPLPDRRLLDEAFPDKPVYLLCADLHTAWVNRRALEELQINSLTRPEFGRVRLGEDGEPDGILFEMDLILPIFAKMTDCSFDALNRMMAAFLRRANSFGITALSDMTPARLDGVFLNYMEKLRRMEERGMLTARLHMYTNLGTSGEYSREKALLHQYASEKLRYCGLKQMIDGVTSTYTGLLLEPYSDRPAMTCKANYPKEVFLRCTKAAAKQGLGIRYHCIGDAAVRWALDCFEEAGYGNGETGRREGGPGEKKESREGGPGESRESRGEPLAFEEPGGGTGQGPAEEGEGKSGGSFYPVNTIEHIESIHPDDIPRFSKLGVIASMQPYHLTLDQNEKISRIGAQRCRYEWPFRSLLDSGARLAFGTDAPVIGLNPFPNLHAAVTRCDDWDQPTGANPQEAVTLAEALTAYTRGAAAAYGREDIGALKEGSLADLIVTDKNLFEIPAGELKDCRVDLTVFDGRIVFERTKEGGAGN